MKGVAAQLLLVDSTFEKRCIMGDGETDSSMGLNKLFLQTGCGSSDFEFTGGFGALDQGLGLETTGAGAGDSSGGTLMDITSHLPFPGLTAVEYVEEKPRAFHPEMGFNQNQIQSPPNAAFLLAPSPSGPKNSMTPKQQPLDELLEFPHQLQLQRPTMASVSELKAGGETRNLQQNATDYLYKAAEMIETCNFEFAQEILARLNQYLSPVGNPFLRAAFSFKEALQLLLSMKSSNFSPHLPPHSLISKIAAYKSFSEISPIVQFGNFTCIQALLEALEGFNRVHIVDFDIGYGCQWGSLMQELALRNSHTPSLKITSFVSPTMHDGFELALARKNLYHFATEINMVFEVEFVSLDTLSCASWAIPLLVSENEAIAVNLPLNYAFPLPLVLRFLKQLSPKIIVSLDRGYYRSDLSFPQHIIHSLQSHGTLLESLDAVNLNMDALQEIERFFLQPYIDKFVLGSHCFHEKVPPWRALFLSCGFSPLTFSNFNESQAECVVRRSPVRGFHIEKRHSSLVLFWQRKELISASAWRC